VGVESFDLINLRTVLAGSPMPETVQKNIFAC